MQTPAGATGSFHFPEVRRLQAAPGLERQGAVIRLDDRIRRAASCRVNDPSPAPHSPSLPTGASAAGSAPHAAPGLTHLTEDGAVRMVDVSGKPPMLREARAAGSLLMQTTTLDLLRQGLLKKGDALAVARVAAIQAAKQTAAWIPLCHPLPLSAVEVEFDLGHRNPVDGRCGVGIEVRVRTVAGTGVEMEALTAVAAAALNLYDMTKAVDPDLVIGPARLLEKTKRPLPLD